MIRGLGVGIVPAATRAGQRNLFTVGAEPEVPPAWSSYAPTTVKLPDGSVKLSTKFTRLTGRSPILLAGMTPTTVDAKIVAAAANAGHWAELAGGGQVTEEIFDDRIAELTGLLEPGRAVQFNSLFLDPYLWKLQVGGKRLVQKARQSGAPIDGVVVSAGIPDLEDAVELIDELNSVGISHVVFKPGTVDQIKSVINIAAEVPGKDVIVHIEGGRAGGHHSWEDLDDLLLATYADLRKLPNITVCVGGGIGTPERAAEYLSGRWAEGLRLPRDAGRRHPGRHRGDGDPGVDHLARGQADAGRDHRHRPLDQRRKSPGRHGFQPQPARRRHPRDRQHRVALRPAARRGRRRRRRCCGPPRRADRRDGQHRQAVLRRHRRHDLPAVAAALRRAGDRRR